MDLTCKWCGEIKPEHDFVKRKRDEPFSQGNVRNCRECNTSYQRERYKNPAIRAKQLRATKRWYEANKSYSRESSKRLNAKRPEQLKARSRVGYLLRNGYWKRQPCCICGAPKSEAHHDSYAKLHWDTVRWLCKEHHEKWHQAIDPIKAEILANSKDEIDVLRAKSKDCISQIKRLRKSYSESLMKAEELELAAWNKVVERVSGLWSAFEK